MTIGFHAGSRMSEVHQYLMTHPGYHAPKDVALDLQCSTHQAAVALRALMERGLAERSDSRYRAAGYTAKNEREQREREPGEGPPEGGAGAADAVGVS